MSLVQIQGTICFVFGVIELLASLRAKVRWIAAQAMTFISLGFLITLPPLLPTEAARTAAAVTLCLPVVWLSWLQVKLVRRGR